jgi:hypothetical protein
MNLRQKRDLKRHITRIGALFVLPCLILAPADAAPQDKKEPCNILRNPVTMARRQ